MLTVTLQEARATLPDLLHRLIPGEEVRITENGRILGRLLPGESWPSVQPSPPAHAMTGTDAETASHDTAGNGLNPLHQDVGEASIAFPAEDGNLEKDGGPWPCRAGSAKGKICIAADFNDPLEAFSEYM
jgi:antitoxin (DNA-binding transcriptional repressor) of toxin-antitoxin stability system